MLEHSSELRGTPHCQATEYCCTCRPPPLSCVSLSNTVSHFTSVSPSPTLDFSGFLFLLLISLSCPIILPLPWSVFSLSPLRYYTLPFSPRHSQHCRGALQYSLHSSWEKLFWVCMCLRVWTCVFVFVCFIFVFKYVLLSKDIVQVCVPVFPDVQYLHGCLISSSHINPLVLVLPMQAACIFTVYPICVQLK